MAWETPSPELQAHLALLKLSIANGLDPVPDEAMRAALPNLSDGEVRSVMGRLLQNDVARHVPEGYVLRGHGPKSLSTRWRLLDRPE